METVSTSSRPPHFPVDVNDDGEVQAYFDDIGRVVAQLGPASLHLDPKDALKLGNDLLGAVAASQDEWEPRKITLPELAEKIQAERQS